jgi:ribose transport system substrate-binding protein/inositol transport system substrate-binding protein
MKKSMAVGVFALVLAGSLFAGGGGQKSAARPKVVMTISNQQNEFIVGMGNSFKTVGAEQGYDVQLLDAQVDPTKQLAQIESAITQGAVAIFLEPCSYDGLTSGLRLAKEAGIPVFTIHNGVSATELITSAIYVNVRQGGSLKMQKCMDDINGAGDIAIMTGTIGQDTTNQIVGGYEEVLAKYPRVNVVFTGSGNWGATDAAPLAENWIASGRKLDAIVCNNDGMALGVLPVLKTTGNVGKIKLYGLDATPEGLKAVKAGEMTATIYVDAHAEIVKAFELLGLIRQGKKVDPEYIIPAVLVDSSNIDKYIK